MYGYPKRLNTKKDYISVKENFPKEQWSKDWQALLDSRMNWFVTGELEREAYGITDETHKVIKEDPMGEEGETKYYQAELQEDPNCKLFKLGLTVEEVEEALES